MTHKIMIAGNWKMNNSIEESVGLCKTVLRDAVNIHKVDVIVAPAFTAIRPVSDAVSDSMMQVAAQNVFWEESGAFTGEVSAAMLREAGARWVIVGHSERRQYFGERDEWVNKRIKASFLAGLKVIACVGETDDEREAGKTFEVIDRQVEEALRGIKPADLGHVVLAYEPVWAIGAGKAATPDQADEVHKFIREKIGSLYDKTVADSFRILYGGSVKPANAYDLFKRENIDGGLIGGASLKAADFVAIIEAGINVSG